MSEEWKSVLTSPPNHEKPVLVRRFCVMIKSPTRHESKYAVARLMSNNKWWAPSTEGGLLFEPDQWCEIPGVDYE